MALTVPPVVGVSGGSPAGCWRAGGRGTLAIPRVGAPGAVQGYSVGLPVPVVLRCSGTSAAISRAVRSLTVGVPGRGQVWKPAASLGGSAGVATRGSWAATFLRP